MANILVLAKSRLEDGRSDIAEALCVEARAGSPNNPDAYLLLGRALLQREGPVPGAVDALRTARELAPGSAEILRNLGVALLRQGDTGAAAEAFNTAGQRDPENTSIADLARLADMLAGGELPPDDTLVQHSSENMLLLARSLIVMDRAAEAGRPLRIAAAAGRSVELLPSLARSLAASGELPDALRVARELWWAVGSETPFRRRMYGTEVEMLCRALEGPMADAPERLILLALVLLDTPDRFHQGLATLNQVLTAGSDMADAFVAGGIAYLKQGEFGEAVKLLGHALKLDATHETGRCLNGLAAWAVAGPSSGLPENCGANDLKLLAEGLSAVARLSDAATVLGAAIRMAPAREDIGVMLADVLMIQGRRDEAGPVVDGCLKTHPSEPHAGMHRAVMALCEGRLRDGWRAYENRFKYWRRDTPAREFTVPRWAGDAPAGRTLMVWREEGVGDEIRFASCLPELASTGFSRIIFECSPRLESLFQRSFTDVEVRGENHENSMVDYDLHIPLFSLPGLLRNSLDDFPDRRSFLIADEGRREGWQKKIQACGDGPYVGICWRSLNASWMKLPFHSNLTDWAPVFEQVDATFINLQVDATADEIAEAQRRHGVEIHNTDGLDLHDDFDAVAAVSMELDGVISARCWVPILSGALGVSTYCFAAPFNPYFLGQGKDPWMPEVTVYEREGNADWRAPMTAIANDLGRWAHRLR